MSKLEEVGARSRATADGDIEFRRRSPRLMKMKEASASLEDQILKLKKERKALMDRREKRWDRQNGEIAARALKLGIKVDVPGKNCKVAEDLQPAGAAEVGQPAGARKKRKKVVKTIVPQALVEYMILNPHNPLVGFREERLGKSPEWFRDFYDEQKALADKMREYQQILIKQYRTKGYAEDYTEVEVTDDEDGTEVTGVEDCTKVTSVEDCTDDKDI